jgi:NAD(P)H-hydrate epimerase
MRILSANQHRALDKATMIAEKISSLQLMERAATAFTRALVGIPGITDTSGRAKIIIFCGTGNNGGDGLVTARLLHGRGIKVRVIQPMIGTRSGDNATNYKRLKSLGLSILDLNEGDPLPTIPAGSVIIDALFGTGLSRPVEGYWAKLIEHLNEANAQRFAIDLPSGLPTEGPPTGAVIRADRTLSLGYPKLALFSPHNTRYLGEWELVDFGLNDVFVAKELDGKYHLTTSAEVKKLLKVRHRNDHKGTFGHALLVAGSYGTVGAAVIAARAIMRAGAGKLTCHLPGCGYQIMQTAFPEAMCRADKAERCITKVQAPAEYETVGVGPGLGQDPRTAKMLENLLRQCERPLVIDADALNLLAEHPDWWDLVPRGSILTPHPKEFERLFGKTEDDFARWRVQAEVAESRGIVLLLKTGYTSVATPGGELYFNDTGNPGMGTAGTGDALTGVLTGLLARGYDPVDAARLGVWLHGRAGDLAVRKTGMESLVAGDLVDHLGEAFLELM